LSLIARLQRRRFLLFLFLALLLLFLLLALLFLPFLVRSLFLLLALCRFGLGGRVALLL